MPMAESMSGHVRRRVGRKFAAYLLIIFGLLFFVIMGTGMFGRVRGEEFAPYELTRRSFYYYELPLLRIQVWPITRSDRTSSLERHLAAKGFKKKPKATRWDLVNFETSYTLSARGPGREADAAILCKYLDAENEDGSSYWLNWTKKNPEAAKVLWAHVLHLARRKMYMLTPDAFDAAAEISDPAKLDQQIAARLSDRFLQLGEAQRHQEKHELAVELYTESLRLNDQQVGALQGRSKSQEALGKTEEARADSQRAKSLSKS